MPDPTEQMPPDPAQRAFQRVVEVRGGETATMLWSWLYLFFLMSSYYVLRPIRDQLGSIDGADNLAKFYTGTFIAMLIAVPLYSALVSRFPRRVFIPLVYQFFALGTLAFYLLLTTVPADSLFAVAVAFYIFTSVYSLFVVTIFWGFMADIFSNDQGKRLFGFIIFAASAGGIVGPGAITLLVDSVGTNVFLLVSLVLLELAVVCAIVVGRSADRMHARMPEASIPAGGSREPVRGNFLSAFSLVFRSPYLIAISFYLFFYTFTSTVLYFQQADLVNATFESRDDRTQFFAALDLATNVIALVLQAVVVGRVMKWIGVGLTLLLLPAFTALGFAAMALTQVYAPPGALWFGAAPILAVFVVFQVLRRSTNYGFARPAREVLFTVLSREEKYKAKSFVDTAVYRGGDLATGWFYELLTFWGAGLAMIAWLAVPVSCAWGVLAVALGAWQGRRAKHRDDAAGSRV